MWLDSTLMDPLAQVSTSHLSWVPLSASVTFFIYRIPLKSRWNPLSLFCVLHWLVIQAILVQSNGPSDVCLSYLSHVSEWNGLFRNCICWNGKQDMPCVPWWLTGHNIWTVRMDSWPSLPNKDKNSSKVQVITRYFIWYFVGQKDRYFGGILVF